MRAAAARAVLVLLGGCRIHFDKTDSDAGAGSMSDGRGADATGDGAAGLMIELAP
jgi:hypothetical protein